MPRTKSGFFVRNNSFNHLSQSKSFSSIDIAIANNYLQEQTNLSEGKQYEKGYIEKNLTFEHIAKKVLKNLYSKNSKTKIKVQMEYFWEHFQNASRYELLFLETRAKSIKNTIAQLENKYSNGNPKNNIKDKVFLNNFVIVAIYDDKLPDDVPWQKNACAIFFDLQFQKIKVEKKISMGLQKYNLANDLDRNFGNTEEEIITILFKPKRMEFLEVRTKATNAKNIVHIDKIKIHFVEKNKHEDYSEKQLGTAIEVLSQMDKIVNYHDDDFTDNFQFKEWFDFVSAYNLFNNQGHKRQNNNNYQEYSPVCLIDRNTEKFNNKLLIFTNLLNLNKFFTKDTKLILNQTAYEHPYIKIKKLEEVKFANYLAEQKNFFNKRISDINAQIEALNGSIEKQKHEFKLYENKIKTEINKYHQQKQQLQKQLDEKENALAETNQKLDAETSKFTVITQGRNNYKLPEFQAQQEVVQTYQTEKEQLQKELKFQEDNLRNLEQQANKKLSELNSLKEGDQAKDESILITKQNELSKELSILNARKIEFANALQKVRIQLEQTNQKLQSETNKLDVITQGRNNYKLPEFQAQRKVVQTYQTEQATIKNQIKQLNEQANAKIQAVKNEQTKLENFKKEHNKKLNKLDADKISCNNNLEIEKDHRDKVVAFLTELVKWKKCQEKIHVASFEVTENSPYGEQDKENNDKSNYFHKMLKTYPHILVTENAFKDISWFKSKAPFLDSSNIGLLTKFKRYDKALWNTMKGYYKNPYMLSSLFENTVLEIHKPLDDTIITKYNLNEKQQKVVEKALNTRDIFYLQGPPGTGKTQTISAITECILQNNENVLMTSSTHEAISNFLDRLNSNVQNNPNVFMYKMEALNSDKVNDYDADSLYDRFIQRVRNYIRRPSTTENEKTTLEIVNFLETIPNRSENHFYSDKWIVKYMQNLQKASSGSNSVANFRNPDFEKFIKDHFNKEIKDFCKTSWPLEIFQEDLKSYVKKAFGDLILASEINMNKSTQSDWFTKLNNHPITDKLTNLEDIYQHLQNAESFDWLDKQMQAYDNKVKPTANNSRHIQTRKKEFIEWLFANEYINVIGLTTTSKTNLQIGDLEKDVYLEYEIDTVIIDEISKSSTPEIFSRINFAKKIIFSGDYMQLPPTAELTDTDLQTFLKRLIDFSQTNNKDEFDDLISSLNLNDVPVNRYRFEQNNDDNSDEEKYLKNKMNALRDKLLCSSFFKNQIMKLKEKVQSQNISQEKWNYDYLKIQHRFNEDINQIVNVFYKDDESLLCANPNQQTLNLNLFHLPKNRGIYMFETSYLSQKFLIEHGSKFNLANTRLEVASFDQDDSVLYKMKNVKEGGRLNDYNAYCIEKIIGNLISNNPNENLRNKIGVICLTTNQKNNVRLALSQYKDYKIKVDTIDNFQGREKEIIIVDFVRAENKYESKSRGTGVISSLPRNLDFLTTKERINVALSRAKQKLILVGAFTYYASKVKEEWFQNMLDIFETHQDLIFLTDKGGIF